VLKSSVGRTGVPVLAVRPDEEGVHGGVVGIRRERRRLDQNFELPLRRASG
jgi:hypothetical protein